MSMLELWAEKSQQITETLELLEFLEDKGIIEWQTTHQPMRVVSKWFGIDLAQLDKERQELLDEQRKAVEQGCKEAAEGKFAEPPDFNEGVA